MNREKNSLQRSPIYYWYIFLLHNFEVSRFYCGWVHKYIFFINLSSLLLHMEGLGSGDGLLISNVLTEYT